MAIPLPEADTPLVEGSPAHRPAGQPHRRHAVAASWRIPLIVWAILLLPTLAVAYLLTRSLTRPLERLRAHDGHAWRPATWLIEPASGATTSSANWRSRSTAWPAQLEARDTELSAELERSDQVLGAMSEGVLLVEAEGTLLRSNSAADRILGTHLSQMQGKPVVVAARSFPAHDLMARGAKTGKAFTEVLELPNGRSLAVEVVPLSGRGRGSAGPTLFVIRDETLRQATERMRRDFATNVSHELKTPLATLTLLAQTLREAIHDDPEQAQKFVAQLCSEIGRLSQLTGELLTLSRLEETERDMTLTFISVDLGRLASLVASDVKPAADAKQHEVSVEAATNVRVRGDEIALRTLLRNLLDNAIRYTDPGGHVTVRVGTETGNGGRSWAVLSVTDDGAGIPLADQQRIFERFYRVDKARSRETGGTGLGLSIVRHVAQRHSGRVDVQSTLGVGSTFTVRLPLE